MRAILILAAANAALAATFGTVVPVTGGATDLVLDEARTRLYIVNSTQNRIDVYSTAQRRFLNPISVGNQPLSAALARGGRYLYVTAYDTGSLDVVDLDAGTLFKRVALPAQPEGVAVGGDERVLITTVGSGTNNADNRLLLYDGTSVRAVPTTLPAPSAPQTIVPGRVFMSTRSNLAASQDGRWIIGLNNPNNTTRQLFVYEVESASILRSRSVSSISNVLAVSRDGSRFMAGLSLFDSSTLAIVAQQNAANAIHPVANNANFNTQQNQGGSVFAPDGSVVYSAFNIAPVQNPAARANTTQLMLSDPENLLIKLTLQLPENLTGNIVASSDGSTLYALSQSGFLSIPVSAIYDNPIAVVDNPAVLIANDQCGVTAAIRKATSVVRNAGKGRMTVTAQVQQTGPTQTQPIGGTAGQGAGAGPPGGPVVIVLPVGPGGQGGGQIQFPGAPGTTTPTTPTPAQQTGITQTAPTVAVRRTDTETFLDFTYNSAAARSLGTLSPTDFLIQSPEAINVPARVRVLQNNRNAEARGTLVPVPVSVSTAEGLVDIAYDAARERAYIANSGLNRVEVLDTRTNSLLDSIKVGQLPRSLALHPNGRLLYVANSGGESISIVDLDAGAVTGNVKFPPLPYNASAALVTPTVLAATLSGVQVVMSDGSLWKVVANEAMPRRTSSVIGSATVTAPRTMAASPGGEYAILLGGNGTAYLYDAAADEYVLAQSVATAPIQGYYGPVAAGPQGRYFVVNGTLLNSSLTPVSGGTTGTSRPVAAVAAVNATAAASFTTPVLANANAAVRDVAAVQMLDPNTGFPRGPLSAALEGPLSTQAGTQRVNMNGRMMSVNSTATAAYVLTATGISVIPVSSTPPQPQSAIQVSSNGVVNSASLLPGLAPGSLVTILGQNLASDANPQTMPLATTLGGSCVTIDEQPAPLMMTAAGEMRIQLPPDLKTGTHALVVRSIDRNVASASRNITVAKYAPAVYVDASTGAAVYRPDGSPVTTARKAKRDEALVLFASGLGATKGAAIKAGEAVPESPESVTDPVKIYFGDSRYSQAEVIVEWSGLAPGFIGLYQVNVRVPGAHMKGDALPVMLRIGGVDSPVTGARVPTVAVE